MKINGIVFRHGEVTWVQPSSVMRKQLPEFSKMKTDATSFGLNCTSVGLVGSVGTYYIVINERDEHGNEYDYTIIPRRSTVSAIYTVPRKKEPLHLESK
jgi:hypothetical protein